MHWRCKMCGFCFRRYGLKCNPLLNLLIIIYHTVFFPEHWFIALKWRVMQKLQRRKADWYSIHYIGISTLWFDKCTYYENEYSPFIKQQSSKLKIWFSELRNVPLSILLFKPLWHCWSFFITWSIKTNVTLIIPLYF